MPTYVVNPNDAASPTDSQGAKQGAEEFRALKGKVNGIVAGAITITPGNYAGPAGLVDFLHINSRYGHRDLLAAGWYPAFFNQQWGGAPHYFELVDSATGILYKFEAFDGYIDTNSNDAIGSAAGTFYKYQGITPAKNLSLQAIWVRAYKTANPVDNLTLKLWSVAAGVPNAVIATANVINGKQITSDINGQWYRFSFAAVQALVANTQYIISLEKSGGVDAVNFYNAMNMGTTKYPSNLHGLGTAAPVWTPANTSTICFLAEAQTSDQSITTGGTFTDGKYTFFEGTPLNHSNARCKELKDFKDFHPDDFTFALFGGSWTKDKTIIDITYGLDHDRIILRSRAADGFPVLTLYEKDGTVNTVTGVSDISTAADKLIGIRVRAKNDGADVIQVWVNGIKEAETTLQSYELDECFAQAQIGTFWLGGGWALASAFPWTQKLDMTTLPSANGWTFTTTTATVEGSVFAVSNGKLNQIYAGMAAGGDGWYLKNALALNNANGWGVISKGRITDTLNNMSQSPIHIDIRDGAKRHKAVFSEYYLQRFDAGAYVTNPISQVDLKSKESVILITGKGSDAMHFVNGKLYADVTGGMTGAHANNEILFGDDETGAGRNAGSIWDYLAYYNTSNPVPQVTSGNFAEFILWAGDKTALLTTLYNAGILLSGKQILGVNQDRLVASDVVQQVVHEGINTGISIASTAFILLAEMEAFVLGDVISMAFTGVSYQDTVGALNYFGCAIDKITPNRGVLAQSDSDERLDAHSAAGMYTTTHVRIDNRKCGLGLHKCNVVTKVSSGTETITSARRALSVEAKS